MIINSQSQQELVTRLKDGTRPEIAALHAALATDEEIRERVLKFFPQPEDIIKVTIPQIMSDKFSGVAYNIYTDKAKPQSARIKVKYPNLDEIWQEIMNYVPVTWEIIVEEF